MKDLFVIICEKAWRVFRKRLEAVQDHFKILGPAAGQAGKVSGFRGLGGCRIRRSDADLMDGQCLADRVEQAI